MQNTKKNERILELRLGKQLLRFTEEQLEKDSALKKDVLHLQQELQTNPLQFFVPHGKAKYAPDCQMQLTSTTDFINDTEHTFCMNCSPNQTGKTAHAVVKKVLRIVPCNPNWEIFKTGVKFREWAGRKILVVLGYDKSQLEEVVWPEYQKWIPDDQLGEYKTFANGGTKEPSWDRHPKVDLRCGSRIIFLTCNQRASTGAGMKADEIHADEQQPLAFFNELDERGRTRGGVMWDVSFTPHKVQGRPDTGMNGWLRGMWFGTETRGHKISRTRISVEEVPNYLYSQSQKESAYRKWIELPKRTRDEEALREGKARFYGYFQQTTGLYYPEIQPAIHFINISYNEIKKWGWTHYRSMDYGYANPTTCGLWAVGPHGDMIRYDEYYVKGLPANEHAKRIIEFCGNERRLMKRRYDKSTGEDIKSYRELVKKQKYINTVLDWHCFSDRDGEGRPISFYFRRGGLAVRESTKLKQEQRAENLRALLRIDPERKHIITGKKGAPRLYISTRCKDWMREWRNCFFEVRQQSAEYKNPKETRQAKDDHAIDDTEYFACSGARYLGDFAKRKPKVMQPISKHGGY